MQHLSLYESDSVASYAQVHGYGRQSLDDLRAKLRPPVQAVELAVALLSKGLLDLSDALYSKWSHRKHPLLSPAVLTLRNSLLCWKSGTQKSRCAASAFLIGVEELKKRVRML